MIFLCLKGERKREGKDKDWGERERASESESAHTPDLYNQVNVLCQGLHTMKAGDETDRNPSIRVHPTSQEKVTL